MRKYIYILASFFLWTACGDQFLKEDPQSFDTPETVYTSTKGFNTALNGLYAFSRLEFQTWGDDAPVTNLAPQGACNYEALQVGTDICITSMGDATLKIMENYTFDPANRYVKSRWKWAYGLIGNANRMINRAEDSHVKWDNPDTDKLYFQANARFFRAYAYRYLTYLYGDVPWVSEVPEHYKTDFVRTPKAEVLSHVIEDLQFAAAHLPSDPNAVKPGQLTKWAALHLLSEMFLFSGDPKSAESTALEVINSGYFHLVDARFGSHTSEVGDYFSDLFKENNQNTPSGNPEAIWVVQDEYNKQGGAGEYNDWTRRAWIPAYYKNKGFIISTEYGGRGVGQIRPLEWLLNSYASTDVRNSDNNIRRDWYYNDPHFPDLYGKKHVITSVDLSTGACFVTTRKFEYGVDANPTYAGNSKDQMRFRIADTYLLLAEAYIDQGDLTNATQTINALREKRGAADVAQAAVNMDYLLDERARELLGEEIRRFTLVRTGTLLERCREYNPVSGPLIKDNNVLWPIPQEVIDVNSGGAWQNNPGY